VALWRFIDGLCVQYLVCFAKTSDKELLEFDPAAADEKLSFIVQELRFTVRSLLVMVHAQV
jgi:hypothetical protein